jgi:hypothetical protein
MDGSVEKTFDGVTFSDSEGHIPLLGAYAAGDAAQGRHTAVHTGAGRKNGAAYRDGRRFETRDDRAGVG